MGGRLGGEVGEGRRKTGGGERGYSVDCGVGRNRKRGRAVGVKRREGARDRLEEREEPDCKV